MPIAENYVRESLGGDSNSVSVVIPTFNSSATIARAIKSVRAQAHRPKEIIVVDDASHDDTVRRVSELGSDILLHRMSVNGGPSTARNLGASLVTSRYIAFLDADDFWYPEKLAVQIQVLEQEPQVELCATDYVRFNSDEMVPSRVQSQGLAYSLCQLGEVLTNPYLGTPTVVLRTKTFRELGGFDASLRYGEDVDLWLRVAARAPIAKVADILVAVANSPSSLTASGGENVNLGSLRAIEKFSNSNPSVATTHRRELAYATAAAHTIIASEQLSRGNRRAARSAVYAALSVHPLYPRAWYLLLRSLFKSQP